MSGDLRSTFKTLALKQAEATATVQCPLTGVVPFQNSVLRLCRETRVSCEFFGDPEVYVLCPDYQKYRLQVETFSAKVHASSSDVKQSGGN